MPYRTLRWRWELKSLSFTTGDGELLGVALAERRVKMEGCKARYFRQRVRAMDCPIDKLDFRHVGVPSLLQPTGEGLKFLRNFLCMCEQLNCRLWWMMLVRSWCMVVEFWKIFWSGWSKKQWHDRRFTTWFGLANNLGIIESNCVLQWCHHSRKWPQCL
jgi:hypothetical protein